MLANGHNVIIHAAKGPEDPRIGTTNDALEAVGANPLDSGRVIGEQLGLMLKEILEKSSIRRAIVTGGDTSGYATRQLGVYALELATPIAPGAPLCLCRSSIERFDGLQLALKGGQNGKADYFGGVLAGRPL